MSKKKSLSSFLHQIFRLDSIDATRNIWIDYAKGIAISMIVFRHVTIGLSQQPGIQMDPVFYDAVWQLGLTFRMPLYFMLSGIFFTRSFQKRGAKGYSIHKFNTIMYPYFVWYLILMSFQFAFDSYSNANFNTAHDFLRIFYDPWGHWWFLYALFIVSVGYMLLKKLFRGSKLVLLAIGIGFNFLAYIIGEFYVFDDILNLFVFFAFGDLISTLATDDKVLLKYSQWRFLIPLILLTVLGEALLYGDFREHHLANLLFACIGIVCASLLCFRLSRLQTKALRVVRLIGQHSLYIYLLHPFCNGGIRSVLYRIVGIDSMPILIFIGFVFGMLLPIIIYRIFIYFNASFFFYPSFRKKEGQVYNA